MGRCLRCHQPNLELKEHMVGQFVPKQRIAWWEGKVGMAFLVLRFSFQILLGTNKWIEITDRKKQHDW